MKKIGIIFGAALLLIGCTKEKCPIDGPVSTICATIPETSKIVLGGDEGITATWAENEAIKVILLDNNTVYPYSIASGAGTKSATFTGAVELEEKNISAIAPAGLYYGLYYGNTFFIRFPEAQQYSSTGINVNYLAMYANGTKEDLKFNYATSVFRFKLYAPKTDAITALKITSNSAVSGYWGTDKSGGKIGLFTHGGSPTYSYINMTNLPKGGIPISTDSQNPTIVNFVVLSGLKWTGMTLQVQLSSSLVNIPKKSDFVPQPGVVYTFPVVECVNTENPKLQVKIDNGEWGNYTGSITSIPTEKIAIKSIDNENAATAIISALDAISKAKSRIILDLSESFVTETTAQSSWINSNVKELYLPSNTKTIPQSCFSGSYLTKLGIPATTSSIGSIITYNGNADMYFEVDPANTTFSSLNGVIYSKDGTKLIQYPIGVTECTFTVPDVVTSFASYAFAGCRQLTEITLNENVGGEIPSNAFNYTYKLNKIYCKCTVATSQYPGDGTGSSASGKIIYVPQSENQEVLHKYETNWSTWTQSGWTILENGSSKIDGTSTISDLSESDGPQTGFWQ